MNIDMMGIAAIIEIAALVGRGQKSMMHPWVV